MTLMDLWKTMRVRRQIWIMETTPELFCGMKIEKK